MSARDIRRFAQAIGDPDMSYLRDLGIGNEDQGRLRAPPLFCQMFAYDDIPVEALPADGSPKELDVKVPADRTVGGGSEFEIFEPVFEGDVITVCSRVLEIHSKQGRSGRLYFILLETTFHNQHNDLVCREVATYIKR